MGFLFDKIITKCLLFLGMLGFAQICGEGHFRATSAPYISGDTFRSFADHIFDETTQTFNPYAVKYGDVVFVRGDLVDEFFKKYHFDISESYVLVVHNSDEVMPGECVSFLDDSKILAWFAQNVGEFTHPKLVYLPMGLENRYGEHGSIDAIKNMRAKINGLKRKHLLYLPKERKQVYEEYLEDLASSKFVLSSTENGVDCYRTWEALYMGAIPIVKTSSLDFLYKDLPVVIVSDWSEVTEDFLKERYGKMLYGQYDFQKLNDSYWFNQITQYKKERVLNKLLEDFFNKKETFCFSQEPIDVVIPCAEKDLPILPYCIESVRECCGNIRRIIVVSSKKLSNEVEWFDEAQYPFTQRDVALALTKSEEGAEQYLNTPGNRCGWVFQQLLKLYAPFVIPDISSNVLVVDADVIFLKPITFQNEVGAPLFNVALDQYHEPYFQHMDRLLPGLKRVFPQYTGITHHMLFQRPIVTKLFQLVEERHDQEFWKSFCDAIALDQIWMSGASEYEIYFNFALTACADLKIRPLKTRNIDSIKRLRKGGLKGYDYIACHSYDRERKKGK